MLVLSRRPGEEILIGDNVKLIVNRISGGRVKIGIAAPENVRVMRGELGRPGGHTQARPTHAKAR
jgi:carbon storage regulator